MLFRALGRGSSREAENLLFQRKSKRYDESERVWTSTRACHHALTDWIHFLSFSLGGEQHQIINDNVHWQFVPILLRLRHLQRFLLGLPYSNAIAYLSYAELVFFSRNVFCDGILCLRNYEGWSMVVVKSFLTPVWIFRSSIHARFSRRELYQYKISSIASGKQSKTKRVPIISWLLRFGCSKE